MEKTNYDDNPRYQKVAEGEYRDTETNETVLVFEGDDADMVRFTLKMNDHQDEYVLTEEDWKRILGDKILGDKYDDPEWKKIYSDESDLNDL
jgi:hypothetical protein